MPADFPGSKRSGLAKSPLPETNGEELLICRARQGGSSPLGVDDAQRSVRTLGTRHRRATDLKRQQLAVVAPQHHERGSYEVDEKISHDIPHAFF